VGAFDHLAGDNLLIDTCTWYALSSISEDGTYNRSESYGSGSTLKCFISDPTGVWLRLFPNAKAEGSKLVWLPHDATVDIRDKITHDSLNYRVVDIRDWQGAAFIALCERIQGVD